MPTKTVNHPKISVVTINYNGGTHLEETIKSICNQNYNDYEFIIVDGESTDNSMSIIEKYSNKITNFISEPDKGIADAMNKGFELSTGDYLAYIHSDDYLLSKNTLSNASEWLDTDHEIFAYGIHYGNKKSNRPYYPRGFNYWMNFKFGLLHQGILCHRNVFNTIGVFDTNFKLAMDYDFFLRAYRYGIKLKRCPYPLSFMRDTGISSRLDSASLRERFLEERKVHYKNNPSRMLRLLYPFYWMAYPKYKKVANFP